MTTERVPTVTHLVVTDLFAGVERYVTTVASATAARGWRVRVIGGRERDMRAALTDDVRWSPAPTIGAALRSLTGSRADDVWHLHMTAADLAAGLLPHRQARVSTRHFAAPRGRTALNRLAGRVAAHRLDVEVAISETVRRATGTPDMPVLLNPVPDNHRPREPEQVIVVAQRLEREKSTVEAVELFAASGLASDGWTLEIHGDGSDRPSVERSIRMSGLDRFVRMAGWTDDMGALYSRAGIVLATAPHEPFGLAVAEAMAAGAPVLASAAGGHLETVGAVDGAALYASGDITNGALVLRALAQRRDLPEYGGRLRRWQRAHLSVDRHVSELLNLYGSCSNPGLPHRAR